MADEQVTTVTEKIALCRQTDYRRRPPKTVEGIRTDLASDIDHIINHPQMYFGNDHHAAMALEVVLWHLCRVLTSIDDSCARYHRIREKVYEREKCSTCTFAEGFRSRNPESSDEQVWTYVVKQWQEIIAAVQESLDERDSDGLS